MARDGSGNYSRVAGPYVGGTIIEKDDINGEYDDIATALSDSINKAGTKAFAANQPMGGFKLTGLGAGSSNGDSVRYEQLTALSSVYQGKDATLDAVSALSWSSGNALVQFTAADTVSLTLAPSVTSVQASNGAGATTPAGRFINTTDAADVQATRTEGDRATPTANDIVSHGFWLSNASGTQFEFARISARGATLTAGAEEGRLFFYTAAGGSLAIRAQMTNNVFSPTSNDGMALGNTSLGWSDLHLASGGVINWANGLVTITHDATNDCIEVAGGGLVAPFEVVTGVSGTLAIGHRNRKLVLSGNVTIDDDIFADGDWHVFDPGTSARTFTRAAGCAMYVNGVDSASATLAANELGGGVWRDTDTLILSGAFT